jgi:hypothetical protein
MPSVTFSSSPGAIIAPAFSNRLFYVLTGHNPATEFKFRYVIDIEVDGSAIARILKTPDANSNNCTFNLSSVLYGQLSPDADGDGGESIMTYPAASGAGLIFDLPAAGTECIEVTIKIGRSYATSASGAVSVSANEDNETLYIFNGVIQYNNENTISDIYYNLASSDNLLSNRARQTFLWDRRAPYSINNNAILIPIYPNAYYTLSFINDDGTYASGHLIEKIAYAIYDADGLVYQNIFNVSAASGAATPGGAVAANQKIVRTAAGPANLDKVSSGLIASPPSAVTDWIFYKIQFLDASNNPVSREYAFINRETAGGNVHNNCGKYTKYQIAWFNDRGGWDYFDGFDLVDIKQWKIERKKWQRTPIEQESAYKAHHIKNSQIEKGSAIILRTHWLQPGESRMLHYMLSSPICYLIELSSGAVTPVIFSESSFNQTLEYGLKMESLTVTAEIAYKENLPTL